MSSEPDVIESNSFSIVCPCCSTILVVCRSALPSPQHHPDFQRDETGWWFSCSQCNYRWWYRSDFIEESSDSHEKIETIQTLKKLLNEFSDDSSDTFSFSSTPSFSQSTEPSISYSVKNIASFDQAPAKTPKQTPSHVLDDSRQNQPPAASPEIDDAIIENIKTQILSEVKTELDSYQKSIKQQANIQNPLFDPKAIPSHIRKIGSAFFPQKKTHAKHPPQPNQPAPKTKYSYKRVLPSNFSVQNIHPEKPTDASPQPIDPLKAEPLAQAKKKSVFFPKILSSLKGIHFASPFQTSSETAPLPPSPVPGKAPSVSNTLHETDDAALPPSPPPISTIAPDIPPTAPTAPTASKIEVPDQNPVIPDAKTAPLHPSSVPAKAPPVSNTPSETNEAALPPSPPPISAIAPDIPPTAPTASTPTIKVPDKNTVITYSNFKANISNTSFRKYPLFSLIDDKPVHFIKKEINIQTYSTYPKQIVQSPKKVFTSSLNTNEFKPKNAFAMAPSPQPQPIEPHETPTLNPSLLNDPESATIEAVHEQPLQQEEPPLDADPIKAPEIPVKKSMFSWLRFRKSTDSVEPEETESSTETEALEPVVEESTIEEGHEPPLQQQEPPLDADPIATPEILVEKKSLFSWFRRRRSTNSMEPEETEALEPVVEESTIEEGHEPPLQQQEPPLDADPIATPEILVEKKSLFSWFRSRRSTDSVEPEAMEPVVEESAIEAVHEPPQQQEEPPLDADPIKAPEIPLKKSMFSWLRFRKAIASVEPEETEAPGPVVEEPVIAEVHEQPEQEEPPLDADPIKAPEIPVKKSMFSWLRFRKSTDSVEPEETESSTETEALEPVVEESTIEEGHEPPLQEEPPLDADPIATPEIPVKKSLFYWFRSWRSIDSVELEETESLESVVEEPVIAEVHEQPKQEEPPLDADPITTPEILVEKKSLFSWFRRQRSIDSVELEETESLESVVEEPVIAEVHEQPLQQEEPPLDADPIKAPEIPVKKSMFSWLRFRKSTDSVEPEETESSTETEALEPVVEEPSTVEVHEPPQQQEPPLDADPIKAPEIPLKKRPIFSLLRARRSIAFSEPEETDASDSPTEPEAPEPAVEDPAIAEVHEQPQQQQEPPLAADPIKAPEIPLKKPRVFTFSLDPFLQKKSSSPAQNIKAANSSMIQWQPSQPPSEKITHASHQPTPVALPAAPKTSPFKSASFHFSSSIFRKKKSKPKVSIELRANHLSTVVDPLPKLPDSISLSDQTSKRIKVALRSNIENKLTQNIKPYIAIKEQSHRPIVIPFEQEETIVLPPLIPTLHHKKQEIGTQNFSRPLLRTIDRPQIPASEPIITGSSNAFKTLLFMIGLGSATTGAILITNQYKEIGLELWQRNVLYPHSHSLSTPLLLKEATYSILEETPTNKLLIVGEVTNPTDHSAEMCRISIKVYDQNDLAKPLASWDYFHFTTHILPHEHILFRTEKNVDIPLNADLHIEVALEPSVK